VEDRIGVSVNPRIGFLATIGFCLALPTLIRAEGPRDWRVGPTAWTFRMFAFDEAVEKTAALGMNHIEAFQGQRVSREGNRKFDANLPDEAIAQIRARLDAARVKLTSIYIGDIPGNEAACRRTFEFARKLGVEFIVSEPDPEAVPLIEKFCEKYRINLAIHNHPEGKSRYWHPREVLKACAGRASARAATRATGCVPASSRRKWCRCWAGGC
jgi:hypothetical protein